MTRQQAIKIYLKTQTHAEEIIRRLMGWNPKSVSYTHLTGAFKRYIEEIQTWAAQSLGLVIPDPETSEGT